MANWLVLLWIMGAVVMLMVMYGVRVRKELEPSAKKNEVSYLVLAICVSLAWPLVALLAIKKMVFGDL